MNLYELTNELVAFQEVATEMQEDGTLDEQVYKDTFEGLSGAYDSKTEGWCKCIKNTEAEAKALKSEGKRLMDRAKVLENHANKMKNTLLQSMKSVGRTEAGGLLKAKIQKNGGLLPVIVDDVEIPEEYQKITIEANNEKIRDALDQGKELSFARYGERGESIRIK